MATITSSGNLQPNAPTIGIGSLAQGHLSRAKSFLCGVDILAVHSADAAESCLFLAGWVLESSLKAYLSQTGKTPEELIDIGHNLEALWREAVRLKLAIDPDVPRWCTLLNTTHYGPKDNPYHARYPTSWSGSIGPNISTLPSLLSNVLSVVESHVQ